MNKIVCNLCGTSYPETASQCPICGTAKTDANKTTTGAESGYAYVKGGRFSKANVRKRNAGQKELPRVVAPVKPKKEAPVQRPAKNTASEPVRKRERKERTSSNLILIIIALLLVVAIIAVCAYIVKEYLAGDEPDNSVNTTTTAPTTTVTEPVPCTGLTLSLYTHTFTTAGEGFMISPQKAPAHSTDPVRFESADERIATVDEKGIVTAVADGTVTIYVFCGDQVAEFTAVCNVGVVPGGDSQPTNPEPDVVLELNRTDFSLRGYGAYHMLYSGELDPAEIIWTTSDETVATVENGKVTAVGNGTAVITAEYMGQTVTCTVRCEDVVITEYELLTRYGKGNDFTLRVGESIVLFLAEIESGLRIQPENLTFTMSKEGVITIDETGKITALASGRVTVTVTYGDLTFESIVRVAS